MKSYKFKIRGHEYEVDVLKAEGNHFEIEVNGTKYQVELDREIKSSKTPTLIRKQVQTHKQIKKKEGSGLTKVKAPLPGNILSISVKTGDEIKKGQRLLIYEAMKMENEVLAEKDGTVANIKVSVGDTVLQGDLLIEIK
jgi:biotin carboxyl carrier protein